MLRKAGCLASVHVSSVLAYLPVAFVFGIAPGPDAMLAMRHSLSGGVKEGVAVALGAATGSVAWGVAAAVGLASLLNSAPGAFTAIRIAGAVYLVYLGIRCFLPSSGGLATAVRPLRPTRAPGSAGRAANPAHGYRVGLVADLLNPKMGAFYLAVLPQFIPAGADVFTWSMVLMAIESVAAVVCLSAYAVLASSARSTLESGRLGVWLERVLGAVLVGFGAGVGLGID